jgi:hypothetical protein
MTAGTYDWSPLDQELKIWEAEQRSLPLWWRDDDAVRPTEQLDQLSRLSDNLGLPVHLAVIPAHAEPGLASYCRSAGLIPVVHGWQHKSHAPAGEKKAEFGAHRPVSELLADAKRGLDQMQDLFGDALVPLFVPPWNRFTADVLPGLADIGYTAISGFTPRATPAPAPGLEQINTHLDPIDWKGSRSLVPADRLIAQVTQDLQQRRAGITDNDEPYGVLTHHLVHDDAIWNFSGALIARLLAGPARPWTYG